jgi:hypothetical protein
LALVLVMTVVLALAIVATPFVLSMILQERTGTVARYASQADFGAEGAKNYALWRLMLGVDPVERRYGTGVTASYYFDTAQEFDVRLDDIYLQRLKIADPKGAIWGLAVQDEQGKLNVRSAPLGALTTLAAAVTGRSNVQPLQFAQLSVPAAKDYVTLYSGRDASWVAPQKIRTPPGGGGGAGFTADNLFVLGPHSRVRVSKPGLKPFEAVVTANAVLGNVTPPPNFSTSPPIPAAYAEGIIEVEGRHPVNLNTARRETLIAVFEGLRWHNEPQSLIDRGAAVQLAQALAGRPIQRLDQFLLVLAGLPLRDEQRKVVAVNAVCPTTAWLEGSGTVPFCFKSYDVYTLEAFSSVNNPSGAEMAGRGFREVVSVSPPAPLVRSVESQLDFDLMLAAGSSLAGLIRGGRVSNYPFGSRMMSFPNMLIPPGLPPEPGQAYGPSDTALKSQQKPGPGGNEALVTLVPARDYRGGSDPQYERDLQGWLNNQPRDHFDGALEGKRLTNQAQTYPWPQIFTTEPPPSMNPGPGRMRPDVAGGGFEVWVRFNTVTNPIPIFDIREQDWSNRLSLRVENNELILTACDATVGTAVDLIDNGAAEVRMPFSPVTETWYHVGAYWKSNRYAQLALLVDGFAHPQQKFSHVSPEGNRVITKLTGAMSPTSTTIALQDDSFLPSNVTPLLVGDEIMVYDKAAGILVRGARGTTPVQHPAQATVSIFGYSSKIKNGQVVVPGGQYPPAVYDQGITLGGATLSYSFGQNPTATVAGDKQDPMTMQWYVDSSQNQIGVMTPNIMDFPDQGYITVNQEVIFYTGRSTGGLGGMPPGTAKFTGCVRGQHGTTAVQHNSGAPIRMWAVPVSSTNNYHDVTIIQAGDEWFGPVRKDPGRPFWISFLGPGGNPLPLLRGPVVMGHPQLAHTAGEPVNPTFLCANSDPRAGVVYNVGRYDRVTVTDASNFKEIQRVRNTGPPPPVFGQPPWSGMQVNVPGGQGQIVAFEGSVVRPYMPDDLHVRLLKFPSGELLALNWIQQVDPRFSIGPLDGTIDELKIYAAGDRPLSLRAEMTAGDNQVQLSQGGVAAQGGCVKVGDEYIGYGLAAGNALQQLKRGWLNSTAEVHDAGDRVFNLGFLQVSSLAADVAATDKEIQLNQRFVHRPDRTRRREHERGYVLLDNELVGYEWVNGTTLVLPARFDGVSGLHRGMFGTSPASHTAGQCLAYGIPYRYYDGYKPREFDNTMPYFQWSTKMEMARWGSLTWQQEIPQKDSNIVVHALVRVDGRGELWDPPGQTDQTLVWDFTMPGATNRIDRVGYLQDAGQLDVRFHFEYRPGSFDAAQPWNAHSWKRAPKIKELRVEYDRPTQTLYHEDR